MFVKITGYNGVEKQSLFTLIDGTIEENKMMLNVQCLNIFATRLEGYTEATKEDPEFVAYANKDILKLEEEIEKKQKLIEELRKALL